MRNPMKIAAVATALVLLPVTAHAAGFTPNPAGDGTTEHFFTVEFAEGPVASIPANPSSGNPAVKGMLIPDVQAVPDYGPKKPARR